MITDSERLIEILKILKKIYPDAKPQLDFTNPFELLIATILSAQCTDARVNIVTKELFNKYKSPQDYLSVSSEELESDIYSTGFYKNKAKNIRACCQQLIELHDSKVPADFELLNNLSGVGRKTASVVAGNAFGIPAIAVDTHVIRLSNLLGIVDTKNPNIIEKRLKELLDKQEWVSFTHYFIMHGRNICIARRPKCMDCIISKFCPSREYQK